MSVVLLLKPEDREYASNEKLYTARLLGLYRTVVDMPLKKRWFIKFLSLDGESDHDCDYMQEQDFEKIAAIFPNLEKLVLKKCKVTSPWDFACLYKMKNLKYLSLKGSSILISRLISLLFSMPFLEEVDIRGCRIAEKTSYDYFHSDGSFLIEHLCRVVAEFRDELVQRYRIKLVPLNLVIDEKSLPYVKIKGVTYDK